MSVGWYSSRVWTRVGDLHVVVDIHLRRPGVMGTWVFTVDDENGKELAHGADDSFARAKRLARAAALKLQRERERQAAGVALLGANQACLLLRICDPRLHRGAHRHGYKLSDYHRLHKTAAKLAAGLVAGGWVERYDFTETTGSFAGHSFPTFYPARRLSVDELVSLMRRAKDSPHFLDADRDFLWPRILTAAGDNRLGTGEVAA